MTELRTDGLTVEQYVKRSKKFAEARALDKNWRVRPTGDLWMRCPSGVAHYFSGWKFRYEWRGNNPDKAPRLRAWISRKSFCGRYYMIDEVADSSNAARCRHCEKIVNGSKTEQETG